LFSSLLRIAEVARAEGGARQLRLEREHHRRVGLGLAAGSPSSPSMRATCSPALAQLDRSGVVAQVVSFSAAPCRPGHEEQVHARVGEVGVRADAEQARRPDRVQVRERAGQSTSASDWMR
jgi:hypothetical protein